MNIKNLVKHCEQGKLPRRQMLQALGVSATAAFVSGAMPHAALAFARQAASGGRRSFPVTHVNHLAYAVADYARSRDFYIDLFGMRGAWDDGKGSGLEFGDVKLPNGIYIRPLGQAGGSANVGHIAYGLQDFMAQKAAIKAEAERRGMKPRADGYAGWSLEDPAGYMIQLTPVKDVAMFPGASPLCPDPGPSPKCKEGYEAGVKMLGSMPKPSSKGFKAYAISPIAFHVPDVAKARAFYTDFMGMKVVSEDTSEVVLRFGRNTLNLRKTTGGKPSVERFGLLVENYDHAAAKAELDRRGLNPQPASKSSWSIKDPDGFTIEVGGGMGG